MILGLNLPELILAAWATCVLVALCFDFGPEIFREQKTAWLAKHPGKAHDPEQTMVVPLPKFDPDETVEMSKINWQEIRIIGLVDNKPPVRSHGRHARV